MVEERLPIKAAQQRLGHSRPDILLKLYAHLLDASADTAAESLSGQLSGGKSASSSAKKGMPYKRLFAYRERNGSWRVGASGLSF
jgi:hypothetical protein